jgi:hypothetical protein
MPGQPGVYQPYANGGSNPSAYHGPTSYQASYGTAFYSVPPPAQSLNHEYEVRKRATFDALNEFFGDVKSRSIDPSQVHAVGERLMHIQHLGFGGQEYGSSPAVATATQQPLGQHYTLPMAHLRTKNDLQNIDQFLEQLQSQVYEHETAHNAAAAGVAQAGVHTVPVNMGYRSSHSPPHSQSRGSLPPMASSSAETPALTPASSVVSYNSPGSVHSNTISPVTRVNASGAIYPTLPSVSSDAAGPYATTSNALPAALGPTFDADGRRRFSSGMLQRARDDRAERESSSPDSMPQIQKLGVRSPTPSNVDPALYEDGDRTPRARSPIDPAITGTEKAQKDENDQTAKWVEMVRFIENLSQMVKERLKNGDYEEEPKHEAEHEAETEADRDARNLYPVLRAVQET